MITDWAKKYPFTPAPYCCGETEHYFVMRIATTNGAVTLDPVNAEEIRDRLNEFLERVQGGEGS